MTLTCNYFLSVCKSFLAVEPIMLSLSINLNECIIFIRKEEHAFVQAM